MGTEGFEPCTRYPFGMPPNNVPMTGFKLVMPGAKYRKLFSRSIQNPPAPFSGVAKWCALISSKPMFRISG
jgi:hypothetical protein